MPIARVAVVGFCLLAAACGDAESGDPNAGATVPVEVEGAGFSRGDIVQIAVVEANSRTTVERVNALASGAGTFVAPTFKVWHSTQYFIDFFVDKNKNGQCDLPADRVGRVTMSPVHGGKGTAVVAPVHLAVAGSDSRVASLQSSGTPEACQSFAE